MHLSEFDYELPEELIAQHPLEQRDDSRMLIVNRSARTCEASRFQLLPDYIRSGDVVVVNNTRVFPARLMGQRVPTGGHVEVLLVREIETGTWEALVRPAHRLKPGAMIRFGDTDSRAEVLRSEAKGIRILKFCGETIDRLLEEHGQTPLPPYIRRPQGTSAEDRERYQTVFAHEQGAIAAPTAGLHFTREIIAALEERQARLVEITLHVGYGTFEPVRVDLVEEHQVAPEFFSISEAAAEAINAGRANGGRVVAVGTTTTRALESAANAEGRIEAQAGESDLTVTPGYEFRATDALLTNFHLPRSSLLLLVSAFAGPAFTLEAYRYAVAQRFRFYSYGDCMLVI